MEEYSDLIKLNQEDRLRYISELECRKILLNDQGITLSDMAFDIAIDLIKNLPEKKLTCRHKWQPNGYGYGFRNFKCSTCGKTKTERTECPD